MPASSSFGMNFGRTPVGLIRPMTLPPVMANCDRPDSWKLVRGSQSPGKETAAPKAPSPDQPDKAADKGKGKDKGAAKKASKPTKGPLRPHEQRQADAAVSAPRS